MKGFNWLVKLLFYKHKEKKATVANTADPDSIFYKVGYIDQQHANLCMSASENMLFQFGGKPLAAMDKNPYGIFEGAPSTSSQLKAEYIPIAGDLFKQRLREKGPFILCLPLSTKNVTHAVVVVGFANNSLIYHDPLTGSNKMLSIAGLQNISGSNSTINIIQPTFFTAEILQKNILKTLIKNPENLGFKKYAKFFTLDKIDQTEDNNSKGYCNAVLNFLKDYSKGSFFSHRTHKKEVQTFVDNNRRETDIYLLLNKLRDSLAGKSKQTQGELYKRLLVIEKVLNRPQGIIETEGQPSDSRNRH